MDASSAEDETPLPRLKRGRRPRSESSDDEDEGTFDDHSDANTHKNEFSDKADGDTVHRHSKMRNGNDNDSDGYDARREEERRGENELGIRYDARIRRMRQEDDDNADEKRNDDEGSGDRDHADDDSGSRALAKSSNGGGRKRRVQSSDRGRISPKRTARAEASVTSSASVKPEVFTEGKGTDSVAKMPWVSKTENPSAQTWPSMRTSPRSLTAIVRTLGVEGLRFDQWYDLESNVQRARVHAFVVLYKWRVDRGDRHAWNKSHAATKAKEDNSVGGGLRDVMHVNQVLNNASATQAVVCALLNVQPKSDDSTVFLGDKVNSIRSFLKPLSSVLRAAVVCNSENIRVAHEAATRCESTGDTDLHSASDVILSDHFWLYNVFVPGKSGRWVYDLDGLADEPHVLGVCDGDEDGEADNTTWKDVAVEELRRRISEFQRHHAEFQIFALVDAESKPQPRRKRVVEYDNDGNIVMPRKTRASSVEMNGESALHDGSDAGQNESVRTENGAPSETETGEFGRPWNPNVAHRIATHDYSAFFVEMMRLLASRGDLNSKISAYVP